MRFFRFLWVKFSTILVNLFGDYMNTKLYQAVINNDYDQVKALLESGANARFAVANNGSFVSPSTILFNALYFADDIRIAEILYQYGAKLIDRNEWLRYVIFANRYNAVKFLIERGAKLPEPMFRQECVYIQVPFEDFDPRIVEILQAKLGFNGPFVNINYFRD